MTSLLLLSAMVFSPGMFRAPELQQFPSSYFNEVAAWQLQARTLARWPGPTRLIGMWESGKLNNRQKAALLLGGAAFHDPEMLPIYSEALSSEDLQLKQAAAWGYRSLIGDLAPRVSDDIPSSSYQALAGEVGAVIQSTRRGTLVQLWLASALVAEGRELPGWDGLVFRRSATNCLHAVGRLLEAEDLPDVIAAYEAAGEKSTKIGLTRFLEALTLQRFILKPKNPQAGWGPKIYEEAFVRVDLFLANNCRHGGRGLLRVGLSQLGVRGLDPNDPACCDVWIRILDMPVESWWPLASGFMYTCGGPPSRMSADLRSVEENKNERKSTLKWYGY